MDSGYLSSKTTNFSASSYWAVKEVKNRVISFILWMLFIICIIFVLAVVSSLFIKVSWNELYSIITARETRMAFGVTIKSLFFSSFITVLIGIPVSYLLSIYQSKISRIIELLLKIPMAIPPMITGLALLMTFGREGILHDIPGLSNVPFTLIAIIMVQIFVMLPLFTQSLLSGFNSMEKNMIEAASICGADRVEKLVFIYLPANAKALLSGLILALLRGAGEFGATIYFAGNLSGKTQTVSTAIYTLAQQNIGHSVALAVILILIFFIPLVVLEVLK